MDNIKMTVNQEKAMSSLECRGYVFSNFEGENLMITKSSGPFCIDYRSIFPDGSIGNSHFDNLMPVPVIGCN